MWTFMNQQLSNHPPKYCISFSFPLISGLILVGLAFYINFHNWNMIHLSAPESDSLRNSYFTPDIKWNPLSLCFLYLVLSACRVWYTLAHQRAWWGFQPPTALSTGPALSAFWLETPSAVGILPAGRVWRSPTARPVCEYHEKIVVIITLAPLAAATA